MFPFPEKGVLDGLYVRLEPLDAVKHSQTLFEMSVAPGKEERFRYLFDEPPQNLEEQRLWTRNASTHSDPLFFAVIDKKTRRAEGRQALMRIDPSNGVMEIGNILWGPAIARTNVATEAFFLMADYVFKLGYRRLEWKCDSLNHPSRKAAERFGFTFEGLFRQHMIVKGRNRDTTWFSIIDSEWPRLRQGYQQWLSPANFDETGTQIHQLKFFQMSDL